MTEDELRNLIALNDTGIFWDSGPDIRLPPGDITLTSPLEITDRSNFRMHGAGSQATRFLFTGDNTSSRATNTAIRLIKCLKADVGGFSIVGTEAYTGISTVHDNLSGPIPSEIIFRDIHVSGDTQYGFYIDGHTKQVNNEFHEFIECIAQDCVLDGFYTFCSQAHRITYRRCQALDCGRYGIHVDRGVYFFVEGGKIVNAGSRDINTGSFWLSTTIDGLTTTGSKQLFFGAEGSPMPVTITNVNWSGAPTYDTSTTSNVIGFTGEGGHSIEDCTFTSTNGNPLRFNLSDADVGGVALDNVTLDHTDAPNNSLFNEPFVIDEDDFQFSATGVVSRSISSATGAVLASSNISAFANDADVGRTNYTLPSTSFSSASYDTADIEADVGIPDSDDVLQYSCSLKLVFQFNDKDAYSAPEICNFAGIGVYFTNEGGGTHKATLTANGAPVGSGVGSLTLANATPYTLLLVWSRERRRILWKIKGLVNTLQVENSATVPDADANPFNLATRQITPSFGRFDGSMTSPCNVWSRALLKSEVEAE